MTAPSIIVIGGLAIIQEPATARHAMMPEAALRCVGSVVRVVSAARMAEPPSTLGTTMAPHPECMR
jgi:hypothetical protein